MGKTTAFSTADEQEYAEVRGNTVPDMLYDVAARAATTSVGLFVYKRIDNLLWTIEKTARWSLPQPSPASVSSKTPAADESEDIGSNISRPPLIRPLPWLLFLPALIALRMVRSALSMGARVVGRGPVLPSSVVGFLQNKRRKLRALKYRGQRLQRIAQIEQNADPKQDRPSSTDQKRVVSKKRNLNQREAESAEEEASDEDSFEDAGCKVLLDKYADEEDSSFNMADASSASSGGTDSSLSDADPSPKKLQSGKQSQQEQQSLPKQNGGQQPPSKSDTLTRSLSENKNGVDSQPTATKTSAQKAINAGNRSKSAADLENGNAQSSNTSETESKSAASTNIAGSTTPSKSIPNLSNSPENNENKPINQNVAGGPTASVAAASQIKSTSPTVLKSTTAKQSPIMSDVRSNFQQQKQASQKQLGSAGQQQQQQQQQQLLQASQQQQQHVGNGAKSRNKKGATQSSFA
ncbi:SUN domain-containing protein 2 isoform X4 [Anopheles stephensi]|uniref:SUN domain-containing protein 2 isoform X4 n=1 Tax=Anopheles stephensi TaxID=30069 RepID=UPI001658A099|nr:SUN domain-containing protein 2 isoform X4 [Anopheles stephensi]